ncbi:hypothetical protein [Pseudacidovorax sp. RU35E]|jgi:hypothetical protein|uniref:hypothetical protein n=1 Tax=Pseudacidovorax sp. RU35E TaxID=1907403 RepID=UPI0009566590|nr:hypothetical protein [Pseudacidovorax sp. RU35E]SIR06089.1 hypothetical protein SAMN05880557_107282 [Pseudacidovorax sp. RU35E]
MDYFLIMVGVALVVGLISVAQQKAVTAPGRDLANTFAALGTLTGRTEQEIVDAVGPANAISAMADGGKLMQWQRTGYHIALAFKEGVCAGVTHEYLHHN